MARTYSKRKRQAIKAPWKKPEQGFDKIVDDHQWRSCTRKVAAFNHQKEALKACETNAQMSGTQWRCYECEYCGKWHIATSKDKNGNPLPLKEGT